MFLIKRVNPRAVALVALESALILGAVASAVAIRLGPAGARDFIATPQKLLSGCLIAAVVQLCLYIGDLYDLRVVAHRGELAIRILQALSATSVLLGIVYFWFPALVIGRGVFIVAAVLTITFVAGWRLAFEWLARRAGPTERLLIVGTGETAVALAREIHGRRLELGVEIAGFIDGNPARVGESMFNPRVLGTPAQIPDIVRTRGVNRVVLSLADARGCLPMDQLLEMKFGGVAFDDLATVYERYMGKIALQAVRPSWMILSSGFRKTRRLLAAKRVIDVSAAVLLLIVAAPVMLLTALAIKLTSPGPALYHQQRVGQDGTVFTVHKFRSMAVDAEAHSGAVWATAGDTRITTIGRIIRKTRVDELPQLWNVVRGDMSFVGPRPERPEFVEMLAKQIPYYRQRHVVKPGLTGWAQVRYAYGASVADAIEKLQYRPLLHQVHVGRLRSVRHVPDRSRSLSCGGAPRDDVRACDCGDVLWLPRERGVRLRRLSSRGCGTRGGIRLGAPGARCRRATAAAGVGAHRRAQRSRGDRRPRAQRARAGLPGRPARDRRGVGRQLRRHGRDRAIRRRQPRPRPRLR